MKIFRIIIIIAGFLAVPIYAHKQMYEHSLMWIMLVILNAAFLVEKEIKDYIDEKNQELLDKLKKDKNE
jgi:ABC-type iron transport system FetAB permease component